MSTPISPPAVIGSGRKELPAYLSNGVVGLRVRTMPLSSGMALINGYTGRHYEREIEAAAVAPYPVAADLALNGVWLSDAPDQAGNFEQSYDFSGGELITRFTFEAAGLTARVEVLTFCCRGDPSLVCQETKIVASKACSVSLRAMIDAAGIAGRLL
jgi:protein-glucosylgalactosylhydroxylysine glucosidase